MEERRHRKKNLVMLSYSIDTQKNKQTHPPTPKKQHHKKGIKLFMQKARKEFLIV